MSCRHCGCATRGAYRIALLAANQEFKGTVFGGNEFLLEETGLAFSA